MGTGTECDQSPMDHAATAAKQSAVARKRPEYWPEICAAESVDWRSTANPVE